MRFLFALVATCVLACGESQPMLAANFSTGEDAAARFGVHEIVLTGDGAADFVLPTGVVGSRKSRIDGSTVYFRSFQNNTQPWTMAFVIDLNGNGLPDVIAATDGAPGLSFLSGNGGSFPVGARIATRGPVSFLTTGDFDGDLITDVAFVAVGAGEDALIAEGKVESSTFDGDPCRAVVEAAISAIRTAWPRF